MSTQVMSTSKKTGVVISKCFEMLCGRCGKRFSSKIIFIILTDARNYGLRDYIQPC